MKQQKYYKLITIIAVMFVSILLISNIVSTKIVSIWPIVFDGWTILFPLSYIFGDILTEVYGYKQTKKIIWMWFVSMLLMSLTVILVWALPPAADWPFQQDYQNILGFTPRLVLASLIAYIAWVISNSYVLAKLKIKTQWKKLWLRTIGSTLIWEWIDTLIFVTIAFYGVIPYELLIWIIISNYIIKVLIEVLFTPITYYTVGKIKTIENEDYYDTDTDFNPLNFK